MDKVSEGWFQSGSKPDSYVIGLDDKVKYNGKQSYYMESIKNVSEGFGTLMNIEKLDKYIGKRVKLTGYIKTENIDKWAGMWMRVDGVVQGQTLGFDNMQNRPIKGTNDWTKYEIVLDVPISSTGIYYGVLIGGNGKVWLNEFSFEIVSNGVPTTNMNKGNLGSYTYNYSEVPGKLKDIPDGIEVKHSPDLVFALRNDKDTNMYYWNHETSVKSTNEDLEIVEFGSYSWVLDHWEFGTVTGKPFTQKDFEDWYGCKDGILKKGKDYTDKSNWERSDVVSNMYILWYCIGKNKNGDLFKGTALVNDLPTIKK
jgi:hypothetical protein